MRRAENGEPLCGAALNARTQMYRDTHTPKLQNLHQRCDLLPLARPACSPYNPCSIYRLWLPASADDGSGSGSWVTNTMGYSARGRGGEGRRYRGRIVPEGSSATQAWCTLPATRKGCKIIAHVNHFVISGADNTVHTHCFAFCKGGPQGTVACRKHTRHRAALRGRLRLFQHIGQHIKSATCSCSGRSRRAPG